MKQQKFWMWLITISLFPSMSIAQTMLRLVSKADALAIVQRQFANQDVDYYVLDGGSAVEWRIFVDAEPMKGWGHNAFMVTLPKSTPVSDLNSIVPKIVPWHSPVQGNFVPLQVKNRYGNNATSKPRVKKSTSLNGGSEVAGRTYAIILNGGVDRIHNYERYWNDCSFIYQTLVNKYCIPKANIFPIMSDGNDPAADVNCTQGGFKSQSLDLDFDGVADISLAATKANVRNTLSALVNRLNQDDHLFLFVIDHGGTTDGKTNSYICLWNGEQLFDYELAEMITPFTSKLVNVNVVLGQCYSGGFNDDLKKVGCVVASAAQGDEPSWACADIPYDEFVYHWTSAVNGANHLQSPVNADVDNNGRVTMDEAFQYAKAHDRRVKEHPVYTSTPISVGEDLAFNHLVPAVDLYIQDNFEDTGKEPNTTTKEFWKSPSIWVRNNNDGSLEHENPIYSPDHTWAFITVRIHNRGKADYVTNDKYIVVYWAQASAGLTTKVWKGREVNGEGQVTGGHTNVDQLKFVIKAGEYRDYVLTWPLPKNEGHFCLLARLLNQGYDDGYVEGKTYFDVLGMNDEAQKNVTIISKKDLAKQFDVYVRNVSANDAFYTLELVPETPADASLYSMAKVEMELSPTIYDAWQRGGFAEQDVEVPIHTVNASPLRTVKFVSPQSQLQRVYLKGNEFDVVRLKFAFKQGMCADQIFTYDLIQRDASGNIVGGETFVVQPPSFSTEPLKVSSVSLRSGDYQLKADTVGFNSFVWTDVKGDILGNQESVIVVPNISGLDYTVTALTNEGDIATQNISLTKDNEIKSVAVSSAKQLKVCFKSSAPKQSVLSVTSVSGGEAQITTPIPETDNEVLVDASNLDRGVYVVSYFVNSKLKDQKKIRIE